MRADSTTCLLGQFCMQQGEWATWIGSIGVVITLAATLFAMELERRRRRDDQRVALEKEHRSQAEQVSAWITTLNAGPGQVAVTLLNGSSGVVYNIVAVLVTLRGSLPSTGEEWGLRKAAVPHGAAEALPPGQWWLGVLAPVTTPNDRLAVELAFTDKTGAAWVRRADGTLSELNANPDVHYPFPLTILSEIHPHTSSTIPLGGI